MAGVSTMVSVVKRLGTHCFSAAYRTAAMRDPMPGPTQYCDKREAVKLTRGRLLRTTQCFPLGNPVTTAGPKARAVFSEPPV